MKLLVYDVRLYEGLWWCLQNKIKVVALKITSNINTLIKDLFHSPPAYKATITLSWKPVAVSCSCVDQGTWWVGVRVGGC